MTAFVHTTPTSPAKNAPLERANPELALDEKIQKIVGGTFIAPFANDLVEEDLRDRFSVMMNSVDELLQCLEKKQGLNVTRRFCRTSLERFDGAPVTVLIIRAKGNQAYVLPSANLMWDPVIPLERDTGGDSKGQKKVLTLKLQGTYQANENPGMPRNLLSYEIFSPAAPVSLVIGNSGVGGPFVRAYPVFSDAALAEARHHAAQGIVTNNTDKYSFILHEVIYTHIRERAESQQWMVDSQLAPMIRDRGTEKLGKRFAFTAKLTEWGETFGVRGSVVESHQEYPGLELIASLPAVR